MRADGLEGDHAAHGFIGIVQVQNLAASGSGSRAWQLGERNSPSVAPRPPQLGSGGGTLARRLPRLADLHVSSTLRQRRAIAFDGVGRADLMKGSGHAAEGVGGCLLRGLTVSN